MVLSARTKEQLRQKAEDVLGYIRRNVGGVDVGEMAYTLQVGREGMEERVGVVVRTVEEVEEKLAAYVGGEGGVEDLYEGEVRGNKEVLRMFSSDGDLQATTEKWMREGKLGKVVELWVKGMEVDWKQLYGEKKPRRMSLPTYPFARERYWVEKEGEGERREGVGGGGGGGRGGRGGME